MTPLLFIGDSISRSWAETEARLFAARGWRCTAKDGETTRHISGRLPEDLENHTPACAHILCGINDIAENDGPYDPQQTRRNLGGMIEACASHGVACMLGTPLPARSIPWRPGLHVAGRIADLAEWIRDTCQGSASCTLVDYHAAFRRLAGRTGRRLTSDGVHPDAAGQRILTATLLASVCKNIITSG